MKLGGSRYFRRSIMLAAACTLALVLTACTGKGGGYLPPSAGFTGQAPFGFTFSCQDAGGINPPTGKLAIELAYSDLGTSIAITAPFSIHGIVDKIDPVLESAICIGQNPPPDGSTLIFLGRYWSTTSPPPPGFPSTCPTSQKKGASLCRFEVTVRDNDGDLKPSKGDFFSIQLSSATKLTSELDPATVFYTREGTLAGGNLTVK
jgi:hypothetical protein